MNSQIQRTYKRRRSKIKLNVLLCAVVLICGCNDRNTSIITQQSGSLDSAGSNAAEPSPSLQETPEPTATSNHPKTQGVLKNADLNQTRRESVYGNLVLPNKLPPKLPPLKPEQKGLADSELHKNHTILILAFEPDLRATSITGFVRTVTNPEQQRAAVKHAMTFDSEFQNLIQRRNELLENTVDGVDIGPHLRRINEETVYLSRKIRQEVYNEILTQDQRDQLTEMGERSKANAKRIAEKKKAMAEKKKLAEQDRLAETQDNNSENR
ncbi:MAG: hypothetical protein AB8B55_06245 [Mariniblastus sp.]